MPGGAIFSAPLVDDCDDKRQLPPLLKTEINYWFRHLWEYWWPLYPGVILALELTGLSELEFIALELPLSLFSVFAGYLFLLRKVPRSPRARAGEGTWQRLLSLTAPIYILIGIYGVVKLVVGLLLDGTTAGETAVSGMVNSRYFPMIIGILGAQIYLQASRPLNWRTWRKIISSPKTLSLAVLVFIVTVYGAFVQARLPGGGFLMDAVRSELLEWGIPLALVIMCVPFVAGMTTGIAVAMVGASFPVVIGLLGDSPPTGELYATTVLAYALGYMGMILSPVHVCLIVSNQYFKTSLTSSLAALLKPAAAVIAAAVCFSLLIHSVW
jgi:integral membrane protein (TIGR00529 family)